MRPPKHPDLALPSTREWWGCPGVVYFLGVGTPVVAVKIGMLAVTGKLTLQTAVARRMGQIQTSNHEPIQLLGLISFSECEFPTREAEVTERVLHSEFAHLARFAAGTKGAEWFSCSPELLSRIQQIAVAPEVFGLPKSFAAVAPSREA